MPVYEYYCAGCKRVVSIWWRSFAAAAAGEADARCPRCKRKGLRRKVSRVAVLRSEERLMDDLTDPSAFSDLDEDDPKSIGRMLRKMGRASGEDMGDEFDEVVDRLEAGQSPEEIEKEVPLSADDLP